MTIADALAVLGALASFLADHLSKGGTTVTAAELLAQIKTDEADLKSGLAADDAAAQSEIDKKFPT